MICGIIYGEISRIKFLILKVGFVFVTVVWKILVKLSNCGKYDV